MSEKENLKTDTPSGKPSVLVVDDDKNTRDGLSRALGADYRVTLAESGERAMQILNTSDVDVLLTDVRMPGMDGLTLLQRALARNPNIVCILLTAYGNLEMAVEAMKRGAFDFLAKPVNLDHLDLLLQRAIRSRRMEVENKTLRQQLDDKYALESIVGSSPAMLQLFDIIRQAAPTQATVLIEGESGTGKELVAHAIHRLSTRSQGPFVPVHCAALSATLLESELFGHEKGAFTGAMARRHGRFESANGGTLFLDEVSEIDPSIQVKLLRVLEERRIERVGGNETFDVDIRLVSASNKDLRQLVAQGKFREDFFFRLDVVNITLPPLRERPGDIPLLCSRFLEEFARANNKDVSIITPDTVNILSAYPWPGNVRELRNTMEKMVVLARGNKLSPRDLPPNIREQSAVKPRSMTPGIPLRPDGAPGSLAETERQAIHLALRRNKDNRTAAAKELGISRRTLHRKLHEYQLDAAAAETAGDGATP